MANTIRTPRPRPQNVKRGSLRLITKLIQAPTPGGFGNKAYVELECGHTAYVGVGSLRARCADCKREQS